MTEPNSTTPTFTEFKYKFTLNTIYETFPYMVFSQIFIQFFWIPFTGKNDQLVADIITISKLWLAVLLIMLIAQISRDMKHTKNYIRIWFNRSMPLIVLLCIYNLPVIILTMDYITLEPAKVIFNLLMIYTGFLLLKLKKYANKYDLTQQIGLFGIILALISILITLM